MSLLEVLIALSLIGLAVSISGVAVRPLIDRQENRERLRQMESVLRQARFEAMLKGNAISLETFADESSESLEALPFSLKTTVRVFPSGVCSPGEIQLLWKNGSKTYDIERLGCVLRAGNGTS